MTLTYITNLTGFNFFHLKFFILNSDSIKLFKNWIIFNNVDSLILLLNNHPDLKLKIIPVCFVLNKNLLFYKTQFIKLFLSLVEDKPKLLEVLITDFIKSPLFKGITNNLLKFNISLLSIITLLNAHNKPISIS